MGSKKQNKISINQVLEIAGDREKLYNERPDDMVAGFNRETETTKGYNGRQILELIQNCDDEGSGKVLIELDKENQTLSIYNEGTPFSLKGYRSLFISNLSSKTSKRNYIGNKGLGFRSILNWSKSVEIISNDISVSFSKSIKKNKFYELFSEKERATILKENNFKSHVIPIPFLSAAEIVSKESPKPYTSLIHINYDKTYYDDIIKQLKSLDIETLLFLKHLEQIEFQGLTELSDIICEKKELTSKRVFGPVEEVLVDDEKWEIFKREGDLETTNEGLRDEKEFYELKIAIPNDPTIQTTRLYSYFPTNIKLKLPFIIHGTFDLDSTRNHLNITDKNKIVLTELVKLITDTAKHFAKKEVSWFPLNMLNQQNGQSGRLEDLEYYEQLDKTIRKEKVWPCLDGKYRSLSNVVYFNEEFSQFIQDHELSDIYPNMLIPAGGFSDLINKYSIKNETDKETERINQVSKRISAIDDRAEFIRIVCKLYKNINVDLLINKYNRPLKSNRTVYSPADGELLIPSYCRIDIINRQLYDELISEFGIYYDRANNLSRELKPIIEFRPFESLTIAQKIISATKQQIAKNTKAAKQKVLESVQALWNNFQLDDSVGDLQSADVPLINSRGGIDMSSELFLSSAYQGGQLTKRLFGDIYKREGFIASPEEMGIEGDVERIEEFFLWLGVNHLTRRVQVAYNSQKEKRRNAVLSNIIKTEVGDNIKDYHYRIKYETIYRLDKIIGNFSKEEILVWLMSDTDLKDRFTDAEKEDTLLYFPKSENLKNDTIEESIDYINSYFAVKEIDFTDHVVDNKLNWINKYSIDYNHPIFKFCKLSKRDIDNLLIELGAKEDFIYLSIERVYQILKTMPDIFPNGKNSKALYKKAVDHYNWNGDYMEGKIQLFAHGDKGLSLYKPEDIYFSDKVKIPQKLQSQYPVLNFPPRAGGAAAIDFFQITDLADIKVEIDSYRVNQQLNEKFETFLQKIKPYLLVYRLNRLDREDLKEKEAQVMNKLQIVLCSKLSFEVGNKVHNASNYEFIPGDEAYYIKIKGNETLNDLRKDSAFSDTFSEIVAHHFDAVSDKSEYRYILRDEENDICYSIENQFGEDAIAEAESLIGSIDYKTTFWTTIVDCIDDDSVDSDEKRRKKLIRKFKNLTIDYRNISSNSNYYALLEIFGTLGITIEDFNRNTSGVLSLVSYHRGKLENYFLNKKKFVKSSIWRYLENKNSKEQMQFLELVNKFENRDSYIDKEADKYAFELNYENIFEKFFKRTYKNIEYDELFLDLTSIEENNKSNFNALELAIINENAEYRSLMYFTDSLEYLKNKLDRDIEESKKDAVGAENGQDPEFNDSVSSIEFLDPKEYTTKMKKHRKYKNDKKVFIHSVANDRRKKQHGDKVESKIYNHLVSEYGKEYVSWESRMNEGLHYDIRYSFDQGKKWIFVEAKTLSYDHFYLSPDEKEFGENNSLNYEIWLVSEHDEIKVLRGFFVETKPNLIPNEYIVYVQI